MRHAATAACCARGDSPKPASPTRCSCAKIAQIPLQFLERQPIGRQLVVATCALLVLLARSPSRGRPTARASSGRTRSASRRRSVAAHRRRHLNQYFDGLDAMASALVRHPGVIGARAADAARAVRGAARDQPLLMNVVLTDRRRHACAAARRCRRHRPRQVCPRVDRAGRPRPASRSSASWYTGQVSGKPTVMLGYPVRDDRRSVVGVLGLEHRPGRSCRRVFASCRCRTARSITLTRSNGPGPRPQPRRRAITSARPIDAAGRRRGGRRPRCISDGPGRRRADLPRRRIVERGPWC